jgi:taurine dioxygenase
VAKFDVHELSPALGAVIEGLDPRATFDGETVSQLRELFDDRGVLLFRELEIPAPAQAYLTGLLVGKDALVERAAVLSRAHIYENYVTNRDENGYAPFGELLFHCDMMWHDSPMEAISLYGVQVDPPSVPTRFISMAHAWDTLPVDMRARVESLRAVHMTGQHRRGSHKEELVQVRHESTRSRVTPVVWQHPRTRRPLVYVSQQMTASIEGLGHEESETMLEELFVHLYAPENVIEHEWRQGDLVVWDNIAAQHARGNVEMEGPERSLRKVIAPKQDVAMARPTMA